MNRQERRRMQREEEKKHKKGLENNSSTMKSTVKFVCLQCNIEEEIPKEVVDYCDVMDDGDLSVPPRFACENCGGEMIPQKYKGVHGISYEY